VQIEQNAQPRLSLERLFLEMGGIAALPLAPEGA
jgi:hypothetical protein